MTWERDVSPAAWIAPALHPFGQDVGSVVPAGFEAYARVFHPVDVGDGNRQRWADVAQRNGRIVHPEMQLHTISHAPGVIPPKGYDRPGYRPGSLAEPERVALTAILAPATTTPDTCWFSVWEGFACVSDGGVKSRVELPHRAYLLMRGSVERALTSFATEPIDQSPSLWWPDDRAWIVATEVDFAWTYVGGTVELIERVLSAPTLEALPARLTDQASAGSDLLNT